MLKVLVRSSAIRSNLFMSCIHFIMLSQEDGCCPLEPKQHQLQTHQTHPISGSLQYHSAAHIDTYMRHSTQQALCPSPSGACPASPRTPGTCPHPRRPVPQTLLLQDVPLFQQAEVAPLVGGVVPISPGLDGQGDGLGGTWLLHISLVMTPAPSCCAPSCCAHRGYRPY